MQIPAHRLPLRDYQEDIVKNLAEVREAVLVVGRRGAKTYTTFVEHIIRRMTEETMTVVIVYPTAKQGFKNFWNNIENDGFKTLDHIPKVLVSPTGNSNTDDDMRITLINGSVLMVLGANNPEALRGANAKIYFFDEFVDIPKEALSVVRPITKLNGGQIILASTPKFDGISGETFRRLYGAAKKDPKKYTCYIDGSHFMSPEQMEELRQEYIDQDGNDFKYRQEVLLDWGQTSDSSYYGEIIKKKLKDKTIGEWPYKPAFPVYTNWDLGRADNMALAFWQWIDGKVRIIDSYQTNNLGLDSIIPVLLSKPYVYGHHFLPWDGVVHSTNDNVSRIDYLIKNGIVNVSTLRRTGVSHGIDLVMQNLWKAEINLATNENLVRNLTLYRRKKNPLTGDYDGPEHNSASHYADTIRYIWTAIEQNWINGDFIGAQKTASTYETGLSVSANEDTYEGIVMTTFY